MKEFLKFIAIWAIIGAAFTLAAMQEVNAAGYVFSENGEIRELVSLGIYTLTAYDPCRQCCGKTDGITASGVKAQANHTIAAPKNIPFGTELIIDGVTYTVEDRGGSIRGRRLDIFFNTHSEAKRYGKQRHEVFMYK